MKVLFSLVALSAVWFLSGFVWGWIKGWDDGWKACVEKNS